MSVYFLTLTSKKKDCTKKEGVEENTFLFQSSKHN